MPMISVFDRETIALGKLFPKFAKVPLDKLTPSRIRQLRELRIIADYDRDELPSTLPKPRALSKAKFSHADVREQELLVEGFRESLDGAEAHLQAMYHDLGIVDKPEDNTADKTEGDASDDASPPDESGDKTEDAPDVNPAESQIPAENG